MDELSAIYDLHDTTRNEPPLGDTTLRNPLVLRVHQILNGEIDDTTGHCRLMLKEAKAKGFQTGTLDECLFLGRSLDILKWKIPQRILNEATDLLNQSVQDALDTYKIICIIHKTPIWIPPILLQYLSASLMIIDTVLRTTAPVQSTPYVVKLKINKTLEVKAGSLVCEIRSGKCTRVVPRDFLLMLSDCINGRLGALLFAWLAECYCIDQTTGWLQLEKIFRMGDQILIHSGQNAYKRFKLLEAVMTTKLLTLSGTNIFTSDFPDSINTDISEFTDPETLAFFKELDAMSTGADQCADLFGLFRLWGHPILDTYKSRDRVKKIAQAHKVVKLQAQQFVEISFKKHLCLGYFRKHMHWPNLKIDKLPEYSELRKAISTGTAVNLYSRNYRDDEWLLISGEHTFSLPLSLNLATLLADKSHSLLRSELEATIVQTHRCGTATDRRVILSFLKGNTPSVESIVREFSSTNINKEYLVFGLREKEREVSPWARLFGLMTLPCRFYFVLTEHLLAHDVVPLFPETTVGDSAIIIRKKKQQIYKLMSGDSNYLVGVINLDFEKWNLNMRYESTEPGFKFLDELYNTGHLFRNSHLVFSKSTMYLCHGVHPVFKFDGARTVPLTGENVWDGHLGGIEGLRQKGWTLLTIATLKEIADRHHVSMQLLGQGDNQVLCVKVNLLDRSDSAITAAITKFNNFRHEVFTIFDNLSLPIKSEETWSSSELFAYGKDLYYQGRRLGLRFKRASRTCFLVNEGYPSLTDYIGSLSSSIITLNEECNSSLVPWLLYNINLRILTYSLTNYHPLLRTGLKSWADEEVLNGRFERENHIPTMNIKLQFTAQREILNCWLIAAKSANTGVPGVCPLDLLLHGFPDGLTVSMTWLWFLRTLPKYKNIAHGLMSPPLSTSPSPLQLCEDPTSIPLLTPPAIKNRLRSLVSQYLSTPLFVKNSDFRNFLNIALNSQLDLATALFNIEPCNPRLMADIIAATPVGQATAIVSQVSSTTTMNRLIYEYEGDNLTVRMKEMELSLINWIVYLISIHKRCDTRVVLCPTEQARNLRYQGWGKDLVGVTVPLSTHYLGEVDRVEERLSYVIVRMAGGARSLLERAKGPFPEYIGSKTKEKTLKPTTIATANLSPLITRPLRLLRLIGWMVPKQSKLHKLLLDVYHAATDIDSSQFIHEVEQVSGSAEHRYDDSRTSHTITPAGSWLASTHNLVNLAQWTDYCKGGKNKTILFQEIIVSQIKLFYERSLFNPNPYVTTAWLVERCKRCIVDTYDGYYNIAATAILPKIPSFPSNDTLYLTNTSYVRILPLIIRIPIIQSPVNYQSLFLSYGVHLAFTNERIGTALVGKIDPLLVIQGYAMGLIAKTLTRQILTSHYSNDLTVNFKKLARKVALDDCEKFVPLELLFQYDVTNLILLNEFGLSLSPSQFPLGKTARRSASRLVLAAVIYQWATGLRKLPAEFHLILEKRGSHYTDELLSSLILVLLVLSRFRLSREMLGLLRRLDHSCRHHGQSQITSLWTIITALNNQSKLHLPQNIISCTESSFEVLLKAVPTLDSPIVISTIRHSAQPSSETTKCPIVVKEHNSAIRVLYPAKLRMSKPDDSARHRLNKPFSHPTSAWYKWSCILRDSRVDLRRPCCLADGAGGLSRYCYDLSNEDPSLKTVFFSTLPLATDGDEYSYECMRPVLLQGLPNVYGITELLHGIGDLTDKRTLNLLINSIEAYQPSYITCDAEHISNWKDSTLGITKAIVKIGRKIKCPVFFKTYREPYLLSRWQITYILQAGLKIQCLLSPYSPEQSSECFLCLTDEGSKKPCIEGNLDPTIKNSHQCNNEYLDQLSRERALLYMASLEITPLWECVVFDLYNVRTIPLLLYHVISHVEDQLTSLKYFPDVGRPGVGKVQYISSSNLTWLVLSHTALSFLDRGLSWTDSIDCNEYVLYLYMSNTRIRSSLIKHNNCIKYMIKRDSHFKNIRRRWITLLSIHQYRDD